MVLISLTAWSQPPSLENPFVGCTDDGKTKRDTRSQPPSLENPFVGKFSFNKAVDDAMCLNLQAWRIPLWEMQKITGNAERIFKVSTSKPGESLCGTVFSLLYSLNSSVSTSKPGESLCGLYR